MKQKYTVEAPKLLQILGYDTLAGNTLKLSISKHGASLMRSEDGRRVDLAKILQALAFEYAFMGNSHGMLIFLKDLDCLIEKDPDIRNEETGEVYTTVTVTSYSGEVLFCLRYDPYHSDIDRYSVSQVAQKPKLDR